MRNEVGNIHEKAKKRRIFTVIKRCLPPLIALGVRVLHRSCRITIIGVEHIKNLAATNGTGVLAFWHCCLLCVAYFFRDRNCFTVISESRDGDLAAGMVESLGYRPFRGSPGKGGARAVVKLISAFRESPSGGFVADGSQGPAQVAQKGIVAVALHSGVPIYPVSMAASSCWRLPSWDRTIVAKPFSRIVMAFGPPIPVARDASAQQFEEHRIELENTLNALLRVAEDAVQGHVAENTESVKIKSVNKLFLRMQKQYPEQGK